MVKTLLGVAVLMATVTAPAAAQSDTVVHDLAVTAAEQQAVRDYWTPERIATLEVGPTTPGHPPVDGPDGSSVATGTEVERTVGRLFFVDRGEDSSCTTTLVTSANLATAVTGGHCVHGRDLIGNDPQWMTKMFFVPGFRDNTRPFGDYVVRSAVVDRHWVDDDQRSEYDQAFLVLNGKPGQGQLIAFGLPGGLPATELGYPRAAKKDGHHGRLEFTGMHVARCWGTPKENKGNDEIPAHAGQWGIPCDMGGGSSGGPRLALFDDKTGRGTVVGVNTQGWYLDDAGRICADQSKCTRHLLGPQFTAKITAPLYARAAAA
ncbi:trypsin-like serine peptidase [Amycolatopsis sp. NPDC059657]|uniref:trypsin-like serine peptidase n=1 Tax=Amycolatopsis sp. NPDC059657 TaxID=3346899 RepID=UPI003672FE61